MGSEDEESNGYFILKGHVHEYQFKDYDLDLRNESKTRFTIVMSNMKSEVWYHQKQIETYQTRLLELSENTYK